MTSNTIPNGTAIASSEEGDAYSYAKFAWKAFDKGANNIYSVWTGSSNLDAVGGYLGYIFDTPVCIKYMYLNQAQLINQNVPYRWNKFKLQGSLDGNTWVDIKELISESDNNFYVIINKVSYKGYRIYCTESFTNAKQNNLDVYELNFYGRS